jgi:hypothetical protein
MSNQPETLYCANHPNVETTLRCNRCEKPICPKCAVLTETGYRCKECVRGQQKMFNTAQWFDYPLVFFIAGLLSFIGSRLVPVMGFFTIFVAPIAGVIIAELIRMVIRKRRSKHLFQIAAIAAALGSLPLLLIPIIGVITGLSGIGFLLTLLWQGIYTFTVTSTVYYRLGGISL